MSELEEKAWELYCDETKGDIDVADFWHQLSSRVRELYLKKAELETD
ncbi:hypothetical protein AU106_gp251 [Sinorhizobium phage phiM9]|uniref:Uncharacterized protein n=1 Tax=Sinorhizobium phage phiM9 TaxID=1636182 RepID=A0A0F6R563_9CAUD|nr:hypothetical protein AU106_gp251 [Sinorhizobium phage phiM9]AKE44882.1 hypothetical protein Sm_phiM9_255 [Sinorhizobium phage phiM9]